MTGLDWAPPLSYILPTVAVSLFAVWLGYRYQIYSLDRETRKSAYLEAEDCLERLADLIQGLEQVNYWSWFAHQKDLAVSHGPERLRQLEEAVQAGIGLKVRLLEVVSQLGVQADWMILSESRSKDGTAAQLLEQHSRLKSAVVHEQERLRQRFSSAIRTAAAASRYGVIWLAILRRSRVQWKTQYVLIDLHARLQELAHSFEGDVTEPRPVDWKSVDEALRGVRTLISKDLGTLGNMETPFGVRRERPPWPDDLLRTPKGPRA